MILHILLHTIHSPFYSCFIFSLDFQQSDSLRLFRDKYIQLNKDSYPIEMADRSSLHFWHVRYLKSAIGRMESTKVIGFELCLLAESIQAL